MRIVFVALLLLCSGLSRGAELPLFFNSGSTFSGTITRHQMQGDPLIEPQHSRVAEKISLNMLTLAGKAVVLMAQRVGTESAFIDTFQIDNDDRLFTAAKTALAAKAKLLEVAPQYVNLRQEVYQPREYANKDLIVAAELLTDGDGNVRRQIPNVTIILHPFDNDTVQGEILVYGPNRFINENLWFDVKRELPPAVIPAPALPLR